jgi:hypothetical protein
MLLTFLFLRLVIATFSHLCEAVTAAGHPERRTLRPDGYQQLALLLRRRETPEAQERGSQYDC